MMIGRYSYTLLLFIIQLVCIVPSQAQQQPQYSQFMFNNLAINPAYAGADEALSFTLLNRNQWTGLDGAPTTQSLGAHTLLHNDKIGLGLSIMYDKIGVHKNLNALTNYAYHIRLKEDAVLSFGLQVGVETMKGDYASLAGSSNDPKLAISESRTFMDFGSGIYFRNKRLHVGISGNRLLSRSIQFEDTLSSELNSSNVFLYSRYQFTLSDKFQLEPGVLIKYFINTPMSYDMNLNLIYGRVLTTGVSYRKNESIDLILKFQLTPQLQFGYAYDYPLKYAAQLSNASHELMIQYVFRNVKKNVTSIR